MDPAAPNPAIPTPVVPPKILGTLKDGNGNPVIGANITLVGGTPERSYVTQSSDTIAANNFTIENLVKGTYTLDISKTGYIPYSTSIAVDTSDINLNLKLFFKLSEDHGVISCFYGGAGTPASATLTRYLRQPVNLRGVPFIEFAGDPLRTSSLRQGPIPVRASLPRPCLQASRTLPLNHIEYTGL